MLDNLTIWINGIVVLLLALATFRKEIVKLFKKDIILDKYSDYDKMMYQAEKALNDCKNMIEAVIPDSFNFFQKWVVSLMLYKAFNGACRDYVRMLIMRNGFGAMTAERFAAYCNSEPIGVMRAVSVDLTTEWSGKEKWFPISREDYEKNNYEHCGKECGERIVKFFIACREIKQGIL